MELNLKILAPLLQCTSIYRCALFITSKNNINFLFCVHITFFLFFILSSFHSPYLSPQCLSISSFFLQTFSPSPISQAQPPTLFSIVDLTSSAATDPSLHHRSHKPSHHRPFRFTLRSFRFDQEGPSHAVGFEIGRLVSVRAQFVGEDHETVPLGAGLVGRNQNEQGIGHGSWLSSGVRWYRGRDRCALVVVVPCFVVSG